MLVLSRRTDEKIVLPSVPVVIKVISAQSGLTRLGIDAPAHVAILRAELCDTDQGLAAPQGAPTTRPPAQAARLALAQLRRQLVGAAPSVRQALDALEQQLVIHATAPGAPVPFDLEPLFVGGAGV